MSLDIAKTAILPYRILDIAKGKIADPHWSCYFASRGILLKSYFASRGKIDTKGKKKKKKASRGKIDTFFNKIQRFCLIKMNLVQTVLSTTNQI